MPHTANDLAIYTDGACSGNPGPGGYGSVLLGDGKRLELSGGFRRTTNNRMELLGIIRALEMISRNGCTITVYSDSKYIVNRMLDGAALRWRANGWMRDKKHRAKNTDLWDQLLTLCDQHAVRFVWVAGHDGNEENERCDALAVAARLKDDLPPDKGYENPTEPAQPTQGMLFDWI